MPRICRFAGIQYRKTLIVKHFYILLFLYFAYTYLYPNTCEEDLSLERKTKEHFRKNSTKDSNGNYLDVKTRKTITPGQEVIGHQQVTWREYQDNAKNHTKTRQQVIDNYNDISNLGCEDTSSNSNNGARTKGLEN